MPSNHLKRKMKIRRGKKGKRKEDDRKDEDVKQMTALHLHMTRIHGERIKRRESGTNEMKYNDGEGVSELFRNE